MAAAQTRLDRLVTLLDSGSTPAIRGTAARQLGQIAALRVRGVASSEQQQQQQSAAHVEGSTSYKREEEYDETKAVKQESPSGASTPASTAPQGGTGAATATGVTSGGAAGEASSHYAGIEGDWNQAVFLLARVLPHLRSKTWDTRVAAGQAIEAICSAAGTWDPDQVPGETKVKVKEDPDQLEKEGEEREDESKATAKPVELLRFSTFSLAQVLTTGKKLLSSAGSEYDLPAFSSVEDRLAHAKRDMQRLGLGSLAGEEVDLGMDVEQELLGAPTPEADSSSLKQSPPLGSRPKTPGGGLPPPRFAPQAAKSSLPAPRFAPGGADAKESSGSPTRKPLQAAVAMPPPSLPDAKALHLSPPSSSSSSMTATAATNATTDASPNVTTPVEEVDLSKLSARERNQLKRKRKLEEKGVMSGSSGSEPTKARIVEAAPASTPSSESDPNIKIKTSSLTGNGATAPSDSLKTPATPLPSTPSGATGGDYLTAKATGTANSTDTQSPFTPRGSVDSTALANAAAANATSLIAPAGQWPFVLVGTLLLADLFSPKWEIRHGAALGLRELFKTQGAGGGKVLGVEAGANADSHTAWCEDAAIRLLCVLSLDRLGDFVFDHVVAPVRETAGQTLASLLKWMPAEAVSKVHEVLIAMVRQDFTIDEAQQSFKSTHSRIKQLEAKRGCKGYAWEVRHAGLLGLKYEVSVRRDLLLSDDAHPIKDEEEEDSKMRDGDGPRASDKLREIINIAILCLRDDDDDVRGVAAATLLPIADLLLEHVPEAIGELLDQLWDCLGDLKDDLSSSTGGVMDLLARLVENSRAIAHLNLEDNIEQSRSVSDLVPRLFPFFRHTITSVRLSVLNALSVFLSVPSLSRDWIDARVLRLLFQNLIVEERLPIREASKKAWSKASTIVVEAGGPARLVDLVRPHLSSFFIILMTPLGSPLDFSLFYKASTSAGMGGGDAHNVDKGILAQDLSLVGVDTVIRGRLGAAEALGSIMAHWPRDLDDEAFHDSLVRYISSSSALQKCLASTVVQEWSESATKIEVNILEASPISRSVGAKLISILESPPPDTYAEMAVMLQRIQTGCQGLYTAFQRDAKVAKTKIPILPSKVDPLGRSADGFTVETAKDVVGKGFDALLGLVSAKTRKTAQAALDERRRKLIADLGFYQATKSKQDTQVAACAAAAVIGLKLMPSKLNPVIRSIMTSVKFEDNYDLQQRSARAVASFIGFCSSPAATANPSDKIIKNLCAFVCQDTTQTPIYANAKDQLEGILSINEVPPVAPKWKGRGGGPVSQADANEPEEVREGKLIRRGAEMTLREVSRLFGDRLFHVVPTLWDCMSAPLLDAFGKSTDVKETQGLDVKDDGQGQTVIDCCTLLQANLANLDASLHQEALVLLPALTSAIKCKRAVVRTAASKAISTMAECITEATMMHIVNDVVALLGDASNVCNRQGAIEAISHVVQLLDLKLLPYVIVLIVPILGRMSDSDDAVRLVATNTFASLVKMVPLETGLPDPPGFSQELLARREEERKFLSQLLDGTKVEPYTIPVKVNAELRKYQQDGVNWMAFLAKFQLHGVLCDDMGLGKTLQSICILAGKHYERAQRYEATKALDTTPLPSLIVCPPTLTGHWCHEIRQYSTNLRPLLYAGLPQERARLQGQIPEHDCVVMSYDTVRNDIAVLSQINWLYCVLDEGHIIKSAKTKTTKAIKMIKSQHRLILSGTPIQNNVLELWSLFDFLMPGFLGTERAFHERFGKPILASRDGKVTAKEHERASLALDALHKQVLPFLLRRMKEDVLNDLPPKIIQDIECDLGDVQRQLYDEFSRTQDRNAIEGAFEGDTAAAGDPSKKHHVFQTLQYLRKLVNHPLLVFDRANKKHVDVERQLIKSGSSLRDVANAPKLLALRQLLNDCGIGESGSGAASGTGGGISTAASEGAGPISQHRVLIFCQLKQMLDIIESDLFKTLMPSVSYMRLDGGVSADKRHGIVQRFNSDPSIDVLLLTTQVGGLGLTLTGADTVIFVEHDWNPMKDMQAMDRAHRLGQKKVVNVYRLITRNTLEARIMGLQRFKLNVANSVVTQQNAGLESMDTDQILDLFDPTSDTAQKGGEETDQKKKKGGISQKALLASIEAMPDTGDDYADMATWQA